MKVDPVARDLDPDNLPEPASIVDKSHHRAFNEIIAVIDSFSPLDQLFAAVQMFDVIDGIFDRVSLFCAHCVPQTPLKE
jgi:hypothetical protein